MGRTAKYKKIKACDPFSKKNAGANVGEYIWGLGDNGSNKTKKRSRTAEKLHQQMLARKLKKFQDKNVRRKKQEQFLLAQRDRQAMNRPPSDDEDEFELHDLQSVQKQKDDSQKLLLMDDNNNQLKTLTSSVTTTTAAATTTTTNNSTASAAPTTARPLVDETKEIREAEKILKFNDNTAIATTYEGRRADESKNAFSKRVKAETRQIIQKETIEILNPQKKRRKKEFLNNKKKRRNKKAMMGEDYDDGDEHHHHHQDADYIPFGHQVERPPTFQSLPRGASAKKKQNNNKNNHKTTASSKQQQPLNVQQEQANLEQMRLQVQQQYAAIKQKRKRGGDFHL